MELASLKQLAKEHGVDPTSIERFAVPTILLHPATAEASSRSWFGGAPLLPDGMAWPSWDARGFVLAELADAKARATANPELPYWRQRVSDLAAKLDEGPRPLDFVCQIDLSEIPLGHVHESLPDRGILTFFAELERGSACAGRANDPPPWQVTWFDDSTRLEIRHLETTVTPPRTMVSAELAWTVPQLCVVDGQTVLSEYEDESFEEFLEGLESRGACGGNQIGGAPFRLQDLHQDPREYAALLDDGFDLYAPPGRELNPPLQVRAEHWQLLLQIATDYDDGVGWSGVMTFWRRQGLWIPGVQPVQVHFEDT